MRALPERLAATEAIGDVLPRTLSRLLRSSREGLDRSVAKHWAQPGRSARGGSAMFRAENSALVFFESSRE
jgi:hypothetical protein